MKKQIAISIICVLSGLLSLNSCKHSESEHHHHGDDEEEIHGKHEHEHEHGSDEIVIEPEDAKRFGIETEVVSATPFNEVISVSGRIISSTDGNATLTASVAGTANLASGLTEGQQVRAGQNIATISTKSIVGGDPNQIAKANLAAAKRELDRLTPLLKEGIVTKGEYNAALAAYESAKASVSPSASGSVSSPISGVVSQIFIKSGEYVEAGAPIAVVSKGGSLILRADLSERYRNMVGKIKSAYFRPSSGKEWFSTDSLGGHIIASSASDIVSTSGYLPVSFAINNNGTLSPGSFAEINLITDSSTDVISLPSDAITEQQGNYFVYVKEGDHEYEKRKIEPGESNGARTAILSGLNPGDEVVVKGAMMVRLAESNGAVPEGHTHNH